MQKEIYKTLVHHTPKPASLSPPSPPYLIRSVLKLPAGRSGLLLMAVRTGRHNAARRHIGPASTDNRSTAWAGGSARSTTGHGRCARHVCRRRLRTAHRTGARCGARWSAGRSLLLLRLRRHLRRLAGLLGGARLAVGAARRRLLLRIATGTRVAAIGVRRTGAGLLWWSAGDGLNAKRTRNTGVS